MRKMEFIWSIRTLRGNQVDKTSRWGGNDVISNLSGSPAGYWTWFHLVSFTGHQISHILCVRMRNRWHTKYHPSKKMSPLTPGHKFCVKPNITGLSLNNKGEGLRDSLRRSRTRGSEKSNRYLMMSWKSGGTNWRICEELCFFFWLQLFWKIGMIKKTTIKIEANVNQKG